MNFLLTSTTGEPYQLLLPIALILVLSKVFSLLFKKLHLPEVVGFLVAGLAVGAIILIPGQNILTQYTNEGIDFFAKIGVIFIMFSAGLETDLKAIKKDIMASIVITSLGVIVPMGLGFLSAYLFFPQNGLYSNLYYGVILSATSVSITVATLKEIGRLSGRVGTAIISAAILDDIIGIILLSLIISLSEGTGSGSYVQDPALNTLVIIAIMIAFFAMSILVGFFVRKLFNWMGNRWPEHRRITMFSIGFCFLLAFLAEAYFGIADITGAYVAGLILSSTVSQDYVNHRTEMVGNLLFIPLFFASIAMKMYDASLDFSDGMFIAFGFVWVLVGLIGKVLGAGGGALICRFGKRDSLKIGVGMMARAEVLIVCAQKGVDAKLVDQKIMLFTLVLIIISSFATPIILKLLFKGDSKPTGGEGEVVSIPSSETQKTECVPVVNN